MALVNDTGEVDKYNAMTESTAEKYTISPELIWLPALYIIFGVVIVIENILMTIVIIRTPRLHSIANVFVTSLALTDAIVGFANIAAGIAFSFVAPGVFRTLQTALMVCYIGTTMGAYLHITVIAIDRYLYIVHPFFYFRHVNKHFVIKTLIALWITMPAHTLIAAILFKEKSVCSVNEFMEVNIVYINSCISLILLTLTLLAYFRIAALSLKHRRSIASVNIAVLSPSTNASQQANVRVGLSEDNWRHLRKTIRFYLIMTGSVAAMTFPITISNFMTRYHFTINGNLLNVFLLLPTLQSGFNLFINIFMNPDFKQALHSMFLSRIVA